MLLTAKASNCLSSLGGCWNLKEDHVAEGFTVAPKNKTRQLNSHCIPVVIVKDNAGFLSAHLCLIHNLLLDVSSKLAAFDLMTQKDHLVWFDHTILDD